MSDLFVDTWGTGTRVVLVHGSLATGLDEWQAQRPLADEGFRLLVLDRRGYGDIETLTLEEYRASSAWERLRYRIYRHPLFLFPIGVPFFFVTQTITDANGKVIPVWRAFWALFGASNQLLAALTLLGVTVWLVKAKQPSPMNPKCATDV